MNKLPKITLLKNFNPNLISENLKFDYFLLFFWIYFFFGEEKKCFRFLFLHLIVMSSIDLKDAKYWLFISFVFQLFIFANRAIDKLLRWCQLIHLKFQLIKFKLIIEQALPALSLTQHTHTHTQNAGSSSFSLSYRYACVRSSYYE